MSEEGVIVADDHWANPGGRTIDALEGFLAARTGADVHITDLVLISTVAEMMQLVFGLIPS